MTKTKLKVGDFVTVDCTTRQIPRDERMEVLAIYPKTAKLKSTVSKKSWIVELKIIKH